MQEHALNSQTQALDCSGLVPLKGLLHLLCQAKNLSLLVWWAINTPTNPQLVDPEHKQGRACMQAEARDPKVPMRTLVSAHMTTWAVGSPYPVAEIRSSIGQAGVHSD